MFRQAAKGKVDFSFPLNQFYSTPLPFLLALSFLSFLCTSFFNPFLLTTFPSVFYLCLLGWEVECGQHGSQGCWHASFSSSFPSRGWISHTVHLVWGSHDTPPIVTSHMFVLVRFFFLQSWGCSRYSPWQRGIGFKSVWRLPEKKETCSSCSQWFGALFCAVGGYCAVTESGCFTHEGAGVW